MYAAQPRRRWLRPFQNAIQSIHDKGYQLIVTVDNGISALEEAEFAASLGVT